jgi:hypothetical protein
LSIQAFAFRVIKSLDSIVNPLDSAGMRKKPPTPLTTVASVVDKLGGNSKLAARIGRTPQAVSMWKASGHFPATTYLAIQGMLRPLGHVAADELFAEMVRVSAPAEASS